MKNNGNEAVTRDELQLAVNQAVNKVVSDMRTSQRWGIGLAVAIILGAISIGTPLILGKQTAEIRAALAESVLPLAREIARNSSDIRWIEKSLEPEAA